jgi:YbbR domain-containing protein
MGSGRINSERMTIGRIISGVGNLVRILLANGATLLLALLLAVIIWATAVRATDPITTSLLPIDVQIINVRPDAALVSQSINTIFIAFEGPESTVNELTSADFTAIIDLADVPLGQHELPIGVRYDENLLIQITSQRPETAVIRLERVEEVITREIPVVVDVVGNVARGHRRDSPLIEPETIQITGPQSRVNQLAEARIIISLDNARQTVEITRRPLFYDIQGLVVGVGSLTLSADFVNVTIPIRELAGFAEKPIAAEWTGLPAEGYRLLNVTVQPNSVLVTGPPVLLESLRALRTEPVDISGLTQSFSQQVPLVLPEGVLLDEIQPVIVFVEIEPILTSAVLNIAPEVRGLRRELTYTIDPPEVRVFLFGPLPVLDSLDERDVRVTLDLLNLEPGRYNLEPIVDVFANEVEVRSFQPTTLVVTITEPLTATEGLSQRPSPSPSLSVNNPVSIDELTSAGQFALWRRLTAVSRY